MKTLMPPFPARQVALMLLCTLSSGWLGTSPASAQTVIADVARVKGQEENELVGLGLVVGLKGTGDGGDFVPTLRSLATTLDLMKSPLGKTGLKELEDSKNVALVMVSATVPEGGGREGDRIDCTVSSIGSAKSLAGGRLFVTALQGPLPAAKDQAPLVYAFAQGPVKIDSGTPTTGKIPGGCRLAQDFFNPYVKDGKITLVLDKDVADFRLAQDIEEVINDTFAEGAVSEFGTGGARYAVAINKVNIEVTIPKAYLNYPVDFVAQVMDLPLDEARTEARVVLHERTGVIVISGDVEIGPAVISHKNIVVETTGNVKSEHFNAFNPQKQQAARLQSLVEALNAIKVPTEDMMEIIKGLKRDGKLRARLIVE